MLVCILACEGLMERKRGQKWGNEVQRQDNTRNARGRGVRQLELPTLQQNERFVSQQRLTTTANHFFPFNPRSFYMAVRKDKRA